MQLNFLFLNNLLASSNLLLNGDEVMYVHVMCQLAKCKFSQNLTSK